MDEVIPCVQLVDGYDSENLKFVCAILGFQKDRGMGGRMPVVQIVLECREHGFVAHVVTKDDQVIAVERTTVIQERNTGIAVLLIEVPAKILLRPVGSVHHGIVHGCVVDGNPSDAVAVPADEKRDIMPHSQCRGIGFPVGILATSQFCGFLRLVRLLDLRQLRKLGKGVDVFSAAAVLLPDLNSAEGHDRRQQKGKNRIEMLGIKLRLLHLHPPHRTVLHQCPASVLRSCSPRNTGRGTA